MNYTNALEGITAITPLASAWAWPLTVLVSLATLHRPLLNLMNGPLSRLIDRCVKITGGGFEATASVQTVPQTDRPGDVTEIDQLVTKEAVVAELPRISALLEKIDLGTGKLREDAYTRIITGLHLKMIFEKIYIFIYGSQIMALKEINARGGLDRAALKHFYDVGRTKNPELYSTLSFDQWALFLTGSQLATWNTDKLVLSIAGKGFLTFILKQGLTELKAG